MKYWTLLAVLFGLLSAPGPAVASPEDDLLPPDEAFRISVTDDGDAALLVSWEIADGYYLYRDRMRFSTATPGFELGVPELPEGRIKEDEFFGKIAIYRNSVAVRIPVTRTEAAAGSLDLTAISQGCADIGVCYPPHTQRVQLDLPADRGTAGPRRWR